MKKWFLFLIASIIVLFNTVMAQSTVNYIRTSGTTASLVNMTNITLPGMPCTQQFVGPNVSVFSSPLIDIGFDFWFMGTRYTNFSVNTNGAIRLGTTVIANTYTGATYITANTPTVAPFFGTLKTSASGKIHGRLSGAAPNRVYVVEFLNMSANSSSTTADATFQLALFETSGIIQYTYGAMNIGATTAPNQVVIGFGDNNTNTIPNKNLSLNAPHAITSTLNVSGTAPTRVAYTLLGAIANLTSATDGARKQLIFSPPVRLAATNLTITGNTVSTMNLSWTDNNPVGATNELGYVIYRSDDGGLTYNFQAQTLANITTYAATGLLPSTNYFWKVYAVSEGALSTALTSNGATIACGAVVTKTATITTVIPVGGINWTALTWVPSAPTACENAEIILRVATGGGNSVINITAPIAVKNMYIKNESVSSIANKLIIRGVTQINIAENLEITAQGLPGAPLGGDAPLTICNESSFTNSISTTVLGNIILGRPNLSQTANEGFSSLGSIDDQTVKNQTFYLLGDNTLNSANLGNFTLNARSNILDANTVFIFNKAGTQILYNNTRDVVADRFEPVLFEDIRIGNTNATTLVLAGSNYNAYINTTGKKGITIGANATLDLPRDYVSSKNYSLNVANYPSAFPKPCYLKMFGNAKLRLGGNGSEPNYHNAVLTAGGVAGSNFPNIIGTDYCFDPSSTIEYYGNNSITQTIYNVPTYANLIANNNGGTGIGRAQKITTAPINIATSFNIAIRTDVTLGTANNLNDCAVACAGSINLAASTEPNPYLSANGGAGLYCNANVVSGTGPLAMGDYSYLGLGAAGGIDANITAPSTFNIKGNYKYNGIVTQITGSGLPATVNDLTIDNATTPIPTTAPYSVSIANNQIVNGVCLLAKGIFDIGTNKLTSNGLGKISRTIPPSITENGTGKIKADAAIFATGIEIASTSAMMEMKGDEYNVNISQFIPQNLSGDWFLGNTIATLINSNMGGIIITAGPASSLQIGTSLEYGMGTNGLLVSNSTIKTNDNLTLLSKPNATGAGFPEIAGTANFGNVTGNFIDGKVSIQRYLNAAKSWRLIAAPIQLLADDPTTPTIAASWREGDAGPISLASTGYGTAITGPSGPNAELDYYTQRGSMKWYSAAANNYVELTNTTGTKIANKEGYYVFVRGDRGAPNTSGNTDPATATTLRIKGKIRTGDQKFDIGTTKYLSVGNPYPARIDFRTALKNNIATNFIVWNPNLAGLYGVGAFQQYVLTPLTFGDYRLNGSSTGAIRNYIESGEAFFIQNNDFANLQPGDITIKETDKAPGSRVQSRPPIFTALPAVEINMSLNASNVVILPVDANTVTVVSGAVVNFDNTFSNTIDNNDARAINSTFSNLKVKRDGILLAADRRSNLGVADTIYLNIGNMISTANGIPQADYLFDITCMGLPINPSLVAKLKDNFLNTETALNTRGITQYKFTTTSVASASYAADRFMIVFAQPNIQIGGRNAISNSVNPIVSNTTPVVVTASSLSKINEKEEAKQEIEKSNPSFSIQPNPATGGIINLQLDKVKAGYYTIQITNQLGQLIKTEQVQVQAKNVRYTIDIATTVRGTYQAILIDEQGNKTTVGFVVQ
jgi:hypothetical protein